MRVEFDAVTVRMAGRTVVDRLTLDVRSGEVVGLVGPNGSGKSTALRCLFGALRPTSGVVRVGGADVASVSLRDNARRVAALTQESRTELDFTVREIVELGRYPHLRGNRRLTARETEVCKDALRAMDLLALTERSVVGLSGGERQRVFLARALAQEPEVLVLDEPTNHLDVRHQIALLSYLRGCGRTVVVALHDLNLAAATCDRVAVLGDGMLREFAEPGLALRTELIRTVFGVEATSITHPATGDPQVLYALSRPSTSEEATS
ncbi:ATP-binding cassette domain-containing protein [Allosaccharopolyspora coralli]|uniref:ATP-binding cassette domain-containing protein n=1 Tax=Allosaccharopolyspora coralli TaxID=2665642 RepID=A0A5Q3QAA3_9PSEU|nr:ABC transporter ATP-binding protein [Allosaccharopolyspora coralli]QGK70124.1 ATP-binding cassette domain-containing protein [Allosaccharopolyspora coralli]